MIESQIAPAIAESLGNHGATSPGGDAQDAIYNVNLSADIAASSDAASFADSLQRADNIANGANMQVEPSALAEALFQPLDYINQEASSLVEYAQNAIISGNELSPSEIVMLTARSQEFMFHAQLTANVANRTAEGMQQLFRQQS